MKKSEEEFEDVDQDDEDSHPLSQLEIEELITTKFVISTESTGLLNAPNALLEVDKLEKARAVGSPFQMSPIECPGGDDDHFLLEEYGSYQGLQKKKKKKKMEEDHAVILLDRVMNASEEFLRVPDFWDTFERSKRWTKTSRVTELALVDALLPLVDARPIHLHVFCRNLLDSDVFDVIGKSIIHVENGSKKYRSLFRVTVKTTMSFEEFIDGVDNLGDSKWTFEVSDPIVTSSISHTTGTKLNMMTSDILRFIELEDRKPGMSTMAAFQISAVERPDVKVNLEYRSELGKTGSLERTIVIEQLVDSPAVAPIRRVTFGKPLVEMVVKFEIDQIPVRLPPKGLDLIEYLEGI